MSLCPVINVEATVLPLMHTQPGEGRAAFAQRVQKAIADELGIPIMRLTVSQKRKLAGSLGRRR